MSKQPEALTLADRLDAMSDSMDMGRPAVNDDRRQAAAELRRLHSLNAELVDALANLLLRDERNTCQHENTHRGGGIWEICDDCGAKWADDRGGKPEWKDPAEWISARAAIAKAEAQQ